MIDSSVCEISRELLDIVGGTHLFSDCRELYQSVDSDICDDFIIEFDGEEFRIISDDSIEDIHTDGVKEITVDCYLDGTELPSWLEVDWEETAKNVRESDGYGNHFASYDGEEHSTQSYYIFRTN
jgi:hypothetical protein